MSYKTFSQNKSRQSTSVSQILDEIEKVEVTMDASDSNQLQEDYYNFIGVHINYNRPLYASSKPSNNLFSFNRAVSNSKQRKSNSQLKSSKSNSSISNRIHINHLQINKVKTFNKVQMLLNFPAGQVKTYFGCLSSSNMDSYNKYLNKVDPNFVRSEAIKLEYSDETLNDLNRKISKFDNFKLVSAYSTKEKLSMDTKIRNGCSALANFDIDSKLFKEFFDWNLFPEEIKDL
jgi:hypothetical protein